MIHRSLLFEAINERRQPSLTEEDGKEPLLEQILKALEATEESNNVEDSSKNQAVENKNDQHEEPSAKEEADAESNEVSKIVAALDKLEQVHREQRENLLEANQDLQNPGVAKVSKMQRKIHSVKENLEEKEKKELHLLDQPNSDGNTIIHLTTSEDDDDATRLLLNHGANPNVQDVDGNSPLHTICSQGDIHMAICILRSKHNGRVLENKKMETPALDHLFFGHMEEDIKKLMEAVDQSNHRKEILEEVLRKKLILFRLVEEDKSEILSIVLKKLNKREQEEYVNLVQDEADGNTCLHIATSIKKSLSCTSILLEAGAKLKTNATGLLPKIEDFFTKQNDNHITPSIVDGVLERVKANQLKQEKALELLLPEDEDRMTHFHQASEKNWELIAEWWKNTHGDTTDFSHVYPRMSSSELEKMVVVARDGHWDKTNVFNFLCTEDKDGSLFLSRLGFNIQTEAALWNQDGINKIAHKISKELLQWIIQQAKEGNWDSERIANEVCQKSSDKRPKLLLFDEEAQKELAVMNKSITCQIIPWLGSNLREWIFQEASEGRWDQAMVFRFLEREEKDGAELVSLKIYPGADAISIAISSSM